MTLKGILEHAGVGANHAAFDRFHNPHNQGYYNGPLNYHPHPNFHGPPPNTQIFKHYSFSQSNSNKENNSVALSALTLLSFMFFLNILQQCLKEQMMTTNPTIAVMTAAKEEMEVKSDIAEDNKQKIYLVQQPINSDKALHKATHRAYPSDGLEKIQQKDNKNQQFSSFKTDIESIFYT